ncbi:MAG: NTP transferase domain-containing protein [Planctomycetota bacterium]
MKSLAGVILAAGKGTRMKSDLPKVVHPAAGRAMVSWVVDACAAVGCERIVVVVGHGRELVEEALENHPAKDRIVYAFQEEQLGTGHAVIAARDETMAGGFEGDVLVLCGDGPLIRAETLEQLIGVHRETSASGTLATAVLDDPNGYGRIVRSTDGKFSAIVEQKNATDEQVAIREVNPSYYCFGAHDLFGALDCVQRDEVSGEYYVTDVPALLQSEGKRVEVIDAVPAEDVLSVNTPEQLAEVTRVLESRATQPEGSQA